MDYLYKSLFLQERVRTRHLYLETKLCALKKNTRERTIIHVGNPLLNMQECSTIKEWLAANLKYCRQLDSTNVDHLSSEIYQQSRHTYWADIQNLPDVPECIWDAKKRILEQENLNILDEASAIKDFINWCGPQNFIPFHLDLVDVMDEDDLIHVRYNIIVERPDTVEGMPIVDGIIYDVPKGHYYRMLSSEQIHGSVPMGPSLSNLRIGISFGFVAHVEDIYADTSLEEFKILYEKEKKKQEVFWEEYALK